mmetsp:Transcript_2273/g.7630  ORF Transcript_2273/g.7630 Transcript_2273/m.7630 type:complete len:216 (-) Transcript_2273:1266-1913(-)
MTKTCALSTSWTLSMAASFASARAAVSASAGPVSASFPLENLPASSRNAEARDSRPLATSTTVALTTPATASGSPGQSKSSCSDSLGSARPWLSEARCLTQQAVCSASCCTASFLTTRSWASTPVSATLICEFTKSATSFLQASALAATSAKAATGLASSPEGSGSERSRHSPTRLKQSSYSRLGSPSSADLNCWHLALASAPRASHSSTASGPP